MNCLLLAGGPRLYANPPADRRRGEEKEGGRRKKRTGEEGRERAVLESERKRASGESFASRTRSKTRRGERYTRSVSSTECSD